jgi:anti-sigma factor RsiW
VTHEESKAKLDTYLDGELDVAVSAELDTHLRECSACSVEALRRVQWKRAIKQAGERHTSQRRAYKPVESRRPLSGIVQGLMARRWLPIVALGLAAVVALAGITISQNKLRQARNSQILGELVDLHIATLASATPVDVVSSDRHTVKPWFAGKIPFTFDLPEFKDTPFELVGGRVSYLDQSPGAELLLRVRKHQVSVFIFQQKAVPGGFAPPALVEARSFHLETFERNGLRYFVIGDVAPEDIQALAELLR